jgi:hypothetical protein
VSFASGTRLGHSQILAPLRADPRFQDLMARIEREWEAFELGR